MSPRLLFLLKTRQLPARGRDRRDAQLAAARYLRQEMPSVERVVRVRVLLRDKPAALVHG